MKPLRIALCQLDYAIADLDANVAAIAEAARRAKDGGAQVALFSELAITAYGPRDLLDRPSFVDAVERACDALARALPPDLVCLVGAPTRATGGIGRDLHNSVLVMREGRIAQVIHKQLLPTYDVFDEDRWFEAGTSDPIVDVAGVKLGITICEDAWNDVTVMRGRRYQGNPVDAVVRAGADVIVNLAGSPFTLTKREGRAAMLAAIAEKHARPVVMVNQVGGHDDLIFDGSSLVLGPDGATWARAAAFAPDVLVCDVAPGGPQRAWPETDEAAALDALALGVRDYAARCGMKSAILGLSGGIDSALVAAIAVRALGPDRVLGIAMPSRYSSEHSIADARALATSLGMRFEIVPIEPIFAPYDDLLRAPLAALGPAPADDVTFENVQARLRMTILMALANRAGAMLLNTGNKSEVACGYCTLYGDMAGGLAVISDLYKTFVYRVSREVNRQAGREIIPESTLTKPPSAELRPNQTDQDTLPPYDVLDAILAHLVEGQRSTREVVEAGFDPAIVARVARMMKIAEFKRRQMPPGLIVTKKAFGPGRRIPIAQRWAY
ncbi:NAD+ synthase [Sandaracinus amylolyticus]|uniref:Glutamine-dependent NAD(+) synthetase n=1 Tax=Sandaracinus amylolyticus TaxID=927083 RepID=A0A0F6W878_9BACT|nr:NAD+ synthase [Sandaracinus amylolyticus]AKF09987.1 NAD synthetase [Sandaracinus amylolyticus]